MRAGRPLSASWSTGQPHEPTPFPSYGGFLYGPFPKDGGTRAEVAPHTLIFYQPPALGLPFLDREAPLPQTTPFFSLPVELVRL